MRNAVFFHCFVAPETRKVRSLKRRVRKDQLQRGQQKCTPLWREAHFQRKSVETAVPMHFLKLRCRKIAPGCGAKRISNSKVKTSQCRATFGSSDVEKLLPDVARMCFDIKSHKLPHAQHFSTFKVRFA